MSAPDDKPVLTLHVYEDGTGEVVSANGSCWPLDRAEVADLRDAMEKAAASTEGGEQ